MGAQIPLWLTCFGSSELWKLADNFVRFERIVEEIAVIYYSLKNIVRIEKVPLSGGNCYHQYLLK